MNYAQICAAVRYLADKGCQLIAAGTDWLLPLTADTTLPGFCYFFETIQKFTNKEALIVGKPSPLLGAIVKEFYNLKNPKRCIFVGDSLTHDVRFAKDSGFQTLLVLTGTTCIEEMRQASEAEQPDYYAYGISDFIKFYEQLAKA